MPIHSLDTDSSLQERLEQLRNLLPELEQQADELNKSRRLQAALFEISELSNTEEDIQEFFSGIHRIVDGLMYAQSFLIAVVDPETKDIRFVYFNDLAEPDQSCEAINSQDQEVLRAGLTYHVVEVGELIHADTDRMAELQQQKKVRVAGVIPHDWMGVPLRDGEDTFGALAVQSYDSAVCYSDEDELVLEFVSQHIASSLQRKWSREALHRAHDELEERVTKRTRELSTSVKIQTTLYRIAQLASESLDLEAFYRQIHEAISDLIEAKNIYVALVDKQAGLLRYPYIVDETEPSWPDEPLPDRFDVDQGPTFKVLASGEAYLFRNQDEEVNLLAGAKGQPSQAWLGVPLRSDETVIGVLAVQSYDCETWYNESDKELLTFVGQHVANAIQHQQDQYKLSCAHRDLEKRVKERTEELELANATLRSTLEQLRATQGQLVQSEKLASLGGLVAGVAHEINTPLGVAITATSHLKEQLPTEQAVSAGEDERGNNALELILDNLNRASKLVSSFKQVAADQCSGVRRRFKLQHQLDQTLTSLEPLVHKAGHRIELKCPEDIELEGYPAALYQIASNLVTNSIAHGFEVGQHGLLSLAVEQVNDAVRLIYQDNGKGLKEKVKAQIFEPFFTTARGAGNTGLGMHIVFNHVTQLGGTITIESEPGAGVRFEILLPRVQPEFDGDMAAISGSQSAEVNSRSAGEHPGGLVN